MRWLAALLLAGCLATVSAVAQQSPQSLAMQDPSPTPPSEAARQFCLAENEIPIADTSILQPAEETAGAAPVIDIANPDPDPAATDTGKLVLTIVTLPEGKCILGSTFYPTAVITVMSGEISIFIEHWPGVAAVPEASWVEGGVGAPDDLPFDGSVTLSEDDWVQIKNESFVGFRNEGGGPAVFVVAGLKPDAPPGGGDCGGNCRNRP